MFTRKFSAFIPGKNKKSIFKQLLDIFLELIQHTGGDIDEAFNWLKEIDDEYKITTSDYTLEDFKNELEEKGYINRDSKQSFKVTAKTTFHIQSQTLDLIFKKIEKGGQGNHKTNVSGKGLDYGDELKNFEFGDAVENIDFSESIKNAQIHGSMDNNSFDLKEEHLLVKEQEHLSQTSTVLMIDISHSMILYGEDRITPAKKVAIALAELIKRKYKNDTFDVVVFGTDAWQVEVKDLPYLQVGPYYTNMVAGLELSMHLLRKRKLPNKQIFMITDGKPTCIKEGDGYYQNSFGFDPKVINRTMNLAKVLLKNDIKVTTFMVTSDQQLREFVEEFTELNKGKSFFTGLNRLGEFMFYDFEKNRIKKTR
ncbi:MAG: hypothetical protein EA412_06245 [Chitinophagaceae bacterium]|nr:MAG: hypothetical protein EA412_06245 [Chitinophagaceae bacterium]